MKGKGEENEYREKREKRILFPFLCLLIILFKPSASVGTCVKCLLMTAFCSNSRRVFEVIGR